MRSLGLAGIFTTLLVTLVAAWTAQASEEPQQVEENQSAEDPEADAKTRRPADPDSPFVARQPRTPRYRQHWYLDVGIGFSDFDDPVLTVSSTAGPVVTNFDDSGDDSVFRISGGYQFNPYFSLETGLVGFGGEFREDFLVTGTPTTTGRLIFRGIETELSIPASFFASPVDSIELTSSISGLTFAAVGYIPLGNRFTLFGKGGALFWSEFLEIETGAFRIEVDDRETATDLFAGIGFRYQITPMIGFGFDVEHFELGSNSADTFNGMVRITFGKKSRERRRRLDP